MKKNTFGRLIEKPRFVFFFSLFIAIIAWFIVGIQFDPNGEIIIKDVPVTYDLSSNEQIGELKLEMVHQETDKISVKVEGKRYKMSELDANSFNVTLLLSQVQGAGNYPLEMTVSLKGSNQDYKVIDYYPKTINVQFATVSSKTVPLTAEAPNITVGDEFTKETPVPSTDKIEVRGPDDAIKKLERAVLRTNLTKKIDTTTLVTDGELLLYDTDGNLLDNKGFTIQNIPKEMTIPVYKQKKVPLTFKYRNAPSSLDTSKLQYTQSVQEIEVAGSADAIDNLKEINIGYVNVRDIDIGTQFKFSIPMPSGFKNVGETTQVTVEFSKENLSSGLFTVGQIDTINLPDGYDVRIDTNGIQNVKAVWQNGVTVTPDDFAATIDFTSQTLKEGKQTVPVVIDIIGKDGVWVVGQYECIITATAKTTS